MQAKLVWCVLHHELYNKKTCVIKMHEALPLSRNILLLPNCVAIFTGQNENGWKKEAWGGCFHPILFVYIRVIEGCVEVPERTI